MLITQAELTAATAMLPVTAIHQTAAVPMIRRLSHLCESIMRLTWTCRCEKHCQGAPSLSIPSSRWPFLSTGLCTLWYPGALLPARLVQASRASPTPLVNSQPMVQPPGPVLVVVVVVRCLRWLRCPLRVLVLTATQVAAHHRQQLRKREVAV